MAQIPTATVALLDQFGPTAVLTDADAMAAYTLDWRGKYPSDALAVVRPDSTAMVADVVRLCAKHDVAITPQGGNTGLVGGSVPTQPRREIVLSLDTSDPELHRARLQDTLWDAQRRWEANAVEMYRMGRSEGLSEAQEALKMFAETFVDP